MPDAITKTEYHIEIESNGFNALDILAQETRLSRQKIKQSMQKGCVWLEKERYIQRLRRAKKILEKGSTLHFYYNEKVLNQTPLAVQLISDKGSYSIWNKPSGMLSQGSKWGDHCTIYRWAEMHLKPERPAFIVHRLDRAASGLIILAHKKKTAAHFSNMFQKHEIEKHYEVSVEGDFSSVLSKNKRLKVITEKLDDKEAESHIQLISFDSEKQQSLLDVEIKTGRKHQIRKHLANLGFPVIGDRLYGAKDTNTDLQLKAVLLRFNCPISGEDQEFRL